jgi:hypothetical protein
MSAQATRKHTVVPWNALGTRLAAKAMIAFGLLAMVGCAGKTTGATNVTDRTATLTATGRCDSGEKCRFYWEYWKASQPRSTSVKSAVQGPINGATPDVNLSIDITGLTPGTAYRWVICGSPNDGGGYGCTGPTGNVGSTTADPPSDYGTVTTLTGAPLAEAWNGTAWKLQNTPTPPGASKASDADVSCTAASACTAVGSFTDSAGRGTLIERWNGSAWTIQSSPAIAGFLDGVSCSSANACTAVGGASTGAPLAERWDGASWTVQSVPNLSGNRTTAFYDVSCASASSCVAVGSTEDRDTHERTPLVEHWNGSTWTIQNVPLPPHPLSLNVAYFNGVSCTSPTACVAVGLYFDTSFIRAPLVERWNGTSWTIDSTPTPPVGHGQLSSVSCTAANACMAVGFQTDSEEGARTALAERWDGSSWTITPVSNSFGLDDVSCSSPSACTATNMQRWNGTSWTAQTTPSLPGPYSLGGVSCSSSTACTAVGFRGEF